jgi:hypothetical protein
VKFAFIVLMAVTYMSVAGCMGANVVASKWDSGHNAPGQTRCEQVDMRDNSEMQSYFQSTTDGSSCTSQSTQHKTKRARMPRYVSSMQNDRLRDVLGASGRNCM